MPEHVFWVIVAAVVALVIAVAVIFLTTGTIQNTQKQSGQLSPPTVSFIVAQCGVACSAGQTSVDLPDKTHINCKTGLVTYPDKTTYQPTNYQSPSQCSAS